MGKGELCTKARCARDRRGRESRQLCFVIAGGPASSDLLIYLFLFICVILFYYGDSEYEGKLFCPCFHVLLMIVHMLTTSDLLGHNVFATFGFVFKGHCV